MLSVERNLTAEGVEGGGGGPDRTSDRETFEG